MSIHHVYVWIRTACLVRVVFAVAGFSAYGRQSIDNILAQTTSITIGSLESHVSHDPKVHNSFVLANHWVNDQRERLHVQ